MMQSGVPGQDGTGRIVMKKGPARGEDSMVNSENFRAKDAGSVPVDQLFFHTYFSSKTAQQEEKVKATKKRKSRKGKDESSDEESIGDLGFSDKDDSDTFEMMDNDEDDEDENSENEEAIWQAMKSTMPKQNGDVDMSGGEEDADDDEDSDVEQYNYSDSDDEVAAGSDKEETFQSAFGKEEDEFDDLDDDGDNLIEDNDDIFGSEDEIEVDIEPPSKSKDKRKKRQKLAALPMFATSEAYAHLLGGSDDEDE